MTQNTGAAQAQLYRRSEVVFALVALTPNLTGHQCYSLVERARSEGNGIRARVLMDPITRQRHVAVVVIPQTERFQMTDRDLVSLIVRLLPGYNVSYRTISPSDDLSVIAAHLLQVHVKI